MVVQDLLSTIVLFINTMITSLISHQYVILPAGPILD
jgi:hypothetical protein